MKNLEEKIKIKFKNPLLLKQALIHRSYLNEHPEEKLPDNERLEFLGDSIIEFVVTEHLYKNYKEPEGILTSWRASLVNKNTLAKIAKKIGLDKYLLLSKGEIFRSSPKAKNNILANTFEAIVGAIYLDQGLKKTKEFLKKNLLNQLKLILKYKLYKDAKSKLQELTQADFKITPTYKILKEVGPDHAKEFTVGVFLNDEKIGKGKGRSKKEAEKKAAESALKKYQKLKKILKSKKLCI